MRGGSGVNRIMEYAATHRLPTLIGAGNQLVQAGVLFHYSHSNAEHFQRAVA